MTVSRGCTLLLCFMALALGVVHVRAEKVRSAARIAAMDVQWIELRRDLWALQSRIARLRAPVRVRDRVMAYQTGLVPPGFDGLGKNQERFASRR